MRCLGDVIQKFLASEVWPMLTHIFQYCIGYMYSSAVKVLWYVEGLELMSHKKGYG